MGLKLVTINGFKYSFIHTCAFDSVAQILLIAATDNLNIYSTLFTINDEYSQFLLNVLEKGITAFTYRKRGEILLKYHQINTDKIDKLQAIDCATAVNDLHKFVCANIPSFVNIVKCTKKCSEQTIIIDKHIVHLKELKNPRSVFALIRQQQSKPRICSSCKAKTNVEILCGNILFNY